MAKQWNTHHNFIGKRVQLHPATDAWMQGDRYGEIVAIREDFTDPSTPKINSAKVLMDKSQRVLTLHADNVNLLS